MTTNTLTPDLLRKMDAYWRAANYLSVGPDLSVRNPLLKRPLMLTAVAAAAEADTGEYAGPYAPLAETEVHGADCG